MATATLTTDAMADALTTSIRQLGESMEEARDRCLRAGRMGDPGRAQQYGDSYFRLGARREELIERAEALGISVDD
jgi:hypothetical protein